MDHAEMKNEALEIAMERLRRLDADIEATEDEICKASLVEAFTKLAEVILRTIVLEIEV